MGERVQFRRRPPGSEGSERGLLGLVALFLLVSLAMFTRAWWAPAPRVGVVVEVRGDVTAPGTYLVDPPTARAAVEAAGGPSQDIPERPVRDGDAVIVGPTGIRIAPMSDPLLVMLPVDLNTADADAVASIPGVGRELAERIIEDRLTHGPFDGLDGVRRVSGVGSSTVLALAPFATVSGTEEARPVRLNEADAEELQRLPGIGPALAERIVADRSTRGPFRKLSDLRRVSGIGPATVRRLEGKVEVTP